MFFNLDTTQSLLPKESVEVLVGFTCNVLTCIVLTCIFWQAQKMVAVCHLRW